MYEFKDKEFLISELSRIRPDMLPLDRVDLQSFQHELLRTVDMSHLNACVNPTPKVYLLLVVLNAYRGEAPRRDGTRTLEATISGDGTSSGDGVCPGDVMFVCVDDLLIPPGVLDTGQVQLVPHVRTRSSVNRDQRASSLAPSPLKLIAQRLQLPTLFETQGQQRHKPILIRCTSRVTKAPHRALPNLLAPLTQAGSGTGAAHGSAGSESVQHERLCERWLSTLNDVHVDLPDLLQPIMPQETSSLAVSANDLLRGTTLRWTIRLLLNAVALPIDLDAANA